MTKGKRIISFRLSKYLIGQMDELVLNSEFKTRADVVRTAIFNLLCIEGILPKSYLESIKSKNDGPTSTSDICGDCKQFTGAVFDVWEDECLIEPECKLKNIIIDPEHPACTAFQKREEIIEVSN